MVANAMAYGSADRPVTVTSGAAPDHVRIAVHNFGSAIPEDKIDKIFLPLERGDKTESQGRSVGLGLYIVSEIAKAHGGRVSVRSDEETGTEFAVSVPR